MAYQIQIRRDPNKLQMFIMVRDGRMSICSHAVFRTRGSKNDAEFNTSAVLTDDQVSRVASIIGFYPKEGDTHYIADENHRRRLIAIINNM